MKTAILIITVTIIISWSIFGYWDEQDLYSDWLRDLFMLYYNIDIDSGKVTPTIEQFRTILENSSVYV